MRITSREKVEDCFDGGGVYLYVFDVPWSRDSIMRLSSLGNLDYYPDFPRPFFRLRGNSGFQVKGVEGDAQCRAIFPSSMKEVIKQSFEGLFDSCADG